MPQRNAASGALTLALTASLALLALARPDAARADKDWPPLPPEHKALSEPKVERDADAEALLWEVKVEDRLESEGVLSIRDHFLRVKVFTQKGAQEWSKREIDYPNRGVSVSDIAARTLRADGSIQVMDRKAISNETIVKTSSGSLKRISFASPGVEPGCIVEYRYREYRRDDDVYSSGYPFQLEIPVHRVVYRIRPISIPNLFMRQLTFHVAALSSPTAVDGYYETTASSLPAFVKEPDMPPEAQQLGFMVLFYTTSEQNTADTYWPVVGRERAETFDREIKADDHMREAARALVAGAATDRERVERIARWVRSDFRVVRSNAPDSLKAHGLKAASDAREAWRQKGGRYRDGLLVFAALARAAGLEVRWMKVPSRERIFFNRNMLSDGYLDSYQVAIRVDGRWSSFDPITRYLPWDMRPWDEEATMGLLCDRDSSRFVETGYSVPENTLRTRTADLQLEPDGTLAGTLRVTWSGHLNDAQRAHFADVRTDEIDSLATETQTDGGTTVRLSSVSLERGAEESSPLGMTAKITLPEFASVTGKRILVEPAVFQAHAKPRYTSTSRRHPVYYRFPWTELDTVRIHIPEGWKVEQADSVQPLSAQGVSDYAAAVMVSDDQRTILYVRRFRMGLEGSIFFPPQYYPGVKQLFDGIQKRDRVALTLTKLDAK
jgi:transglutaminase-like putative cysteine protease